MNVEAGETVAAGAPLVRLEQRRYRARLRAAELAARAAEVHLEEATRERDRTRELYDRTLATLSFEAERAAEDPKVFTRIHVHFRIGGKGLTTLYVTSARLGLSAEALAANPHEGALLAIETGVTGTPLRTMNRHIAGAPNIVVQR